MAETDGIGDYNLFLSWSGERSRVAAERFGAWIAHEQSRVRPWISTKDMPPGKPWFGEVARQLKLKVGIIFVTPENSSNPWLSFEAGAIFNRIGRTGRTFVMLVRFPEEGLSANHPLAQLHYVRGDEDGCRGVYLGIAEALSEERQDARILANAFTTCWPKLRDSLACIPEEADGPINPGATNPLAEVREALRTQGNLVAQIASDVSRLAVERWSTPAEIASRSAQYWLSDLERRAASGDANAVLQLNFLQAPRPESPPESGGAKKK